MMSMVFRGPTSLHSKWHVDRFISFFRAHDRDQQTHTHTGHTVSVAIDRTLTLCMRCGEIIIRACLLDPLSSDALPL